MAHHRSSKLVMCVADRFRDTHDYIHHLAQAPWTTVSEMLIRSQEVGTLPSAPEFGDTGTWPPTATDWLPLRWELFSAETSSGRHSQHTWLLAI